MEQISATRDMRHAPDAVFDRLLDVGGYPAWLWGCVGSTLESGEPGEPGAVHRLDFRIGPVAESERFAVAELDPGGRHLRLAKPAGGKPLELDLDVAGDGARRCAVSVVLRHGFTAKFLGMSVGGPLFRAMLVRRLDQSVRSLARRLDEVGR